MVQNYAEITKIIRDEIHRELWRKDFVPSVFKKFLFEDLKKYTSQLTTEQLNARLKEVLLEIKGFVSRQGVASQKRLQKQMQKEMQKRIQKQIQDSAKVSSEEYQRYIGALDEDYQSRLKVTFDGIDMVAERVADLDIRNGQEHDDFSRKFEAFEHRIHQLVVNGSE